MNGLANGEVPFGPGTAEAEHVATSAASAASDTSQAPDRDTGFLIRPPAVHGRSSRRLFLRPTQDVVTRSLALLLHSIGGGDPSHGGSQVLAFCADSCARRTDNRRVHDTLCGVSLGGGESRGRRPEGAVNLAERLAKSGNLQKPADGRKRVPNSAVDICRRATTTPAESASYSGAQSVTRSQERTCATNISAVLNKLHRNARAARLLRLLYETEID